MADANTSGRNWAPLLALLLALAAVLSNLLIFLRLPADRMIVWLSLGLAVVALVFLFTGIRRAFTTGRGKVLSSIGGVLSLLLCALAIFAFFSARAIPASKGAPQVGQKAPDFTLTDTGGKQVSLTQLLTTPLPNGSAPKAALLVFYRGYW